MSKSVRAALRRPFATSASLNVQPQRRKGAETYCHAVRYASRSTLRFPGEMSEAPPKAIRIFNKTKNFDRVFSVAIIFVFYASE